MLLAVSWILHIVAASVNYADLVTDMQSTLDECLGIIGYARDYVSEVESLSVARRRLVEEDGTDVKLGSCVSMLMAVDNYRDQHSKLVWALDFLPWQEKLFINQLLKPSSKEIGLVPLYVASIDGDGASDFHEKCDGKGPTVVIVKTKDGYVFGGYTDVVWKSSSYGRWGGSSESSFLFQLHPEFLRYTIREPEEAVMHYYSVGPTFGLFDLRIVDGALSNGNSETTARSYNIGGGEHGMNGGEQYFEVEDHAVFEAVEIS